MPYRYREFKDIAPSEWSACLVAKDFTGNGHQDDSVSQRYYTPSYTRQYERMWEHDSNYQEHEIFQSHDRDRRNNLWKSCQHYKCYMAYPEVYVGSDLVPWVVPDESRSWGTYSTRTGGISKLVFATSNQFTDRFGVLGEHTAGLPSMTLSPQKDQTFVPDPTGLSTLIARSMKSMLPHIKSELSLVNSIIELKDFLTLKTTLSRIGHTTMNIASFVKKGRKALGSNPFSLVRKSFKPSQGLTLRELLHSTADGYLQAEFNILPFLSDVSAIFRACASLSKTMNSLVQNQGRLRRKHWAYSWLPAQFTGSNVTYEWRVNPNPTGQFAGKDFSTSDHSKTGCLRCYAYGLNMTRECAVIEPALFHAEIEYSYQFTQYQTEHAQLLGLLDLLGVNLDPRIIWNAIPWSFVIDWVVGVGRYLHDRRSINMEPAVSISRYVWSWKTSRRVRVSFESQPGVKPPILGRSIMPDLYESIYKRSVILPSFTDPLIGGELSAQELSLGGALAITRAFHPTRGLG